VDTARWPGAGVGRVGRDGRVAAVRRAVGGLGAALTILGLGVLGLFTPPYLHAVLRFAGSAGILGLSQSATQALSDRTVRELVLGPARFDFPMAPGGPRFYDAAEAAHLRDAAGLLHGFLAVVALGALALLLVLVPGRRDPGTWRAVARGAAALAGVVAVAGVFFAVAFDAAFTLFHEIFFPQGDWSFNPLTERMVQLYPTRFWELLSMTLALVLLLLCAVVWGAATSRARTLDRELAREAAAAEPTASFMAPGGRA
jgi:integral membrane protein (TIGR01906 family)